VKAIVYDKYGPPEVLHIAEVPRPELKDNEVMVKVFAVSVNYGDTAARNFKSLTSKTFNMPLLLMYITRLGFGLKNPKKKILGNEFAGKIEAVGKAVTRYKKGDDVFGYLASNMGAYAEYARISENGILAGMPAGTSYEEAASAPYGAIVALEVLKKVKVKPGDKVLVNGASGAIGSAALQILKNQGAVVTGTCSTARIAYIKALGADTVIDYTKEDFTHSGEVYSLIVDVLGKSSFAHGKKVLSPTGVCLYTSFKTGKLFQMLFSAGSKRKAVCALSMGKRESLEELKQMIEAGKYKTIIDKGYPPEQAAEAHQYLESGRAQGKIVIAMDPRAKLKPVK
jgi:NADPH:quinone reductase-like Zn-dependent oxidoreductase